MNRIYDKLWKKYKYNLKTVFSVWMCFLSQFTIFTMSDQKDEDI